MIAISTSPTFPAMKAEVNIKYFAKKPAVGGMPANDNKAIVMTIASIGFVFDKPLKAFTPSEFLASEIIFTIANVAIEPIEYADA